ncbi:MAG: amino acid permease [Alphaproteobacteria bacterium]|nr:amino acid permease [Alphaproteobacteria bacterium]
MTASGPPFVLKRELGVLGATAMGLGSIIGTGVFVSIGIAAGAAGPAVILATALAAVVAACNALSSAQLAAGHAVSGGTYEYGYRYLTPELGFTAGWMFLCAKTASAATAVLGFSGYLLRLVGGADAWHVPIAVTATTAFTVLVLGGLKQSSVVNISIVAVTIGSLAIFVLVGLLDLARNGERTLSPLFPTSGGVGGFFYATALMFVAYAGYARIATLGEEIKDPKRNIPLAIIILLLVTAALYITVAAVAIGGAGVGVLSRAAERSATPLEAAARALSTPGIGSIIAIGAITAMLGVLLNLILGLSRVALAMGRRGDLPPLFGRLNKDASAPSAAVIGAGLAIGSLALIGNVQTTWAFSAFSILVYYAITNLAALRLPKADRLYPPVIAWSGLGACLFLAFFVPPPIWLIGLALIGAGLVWHVIARRLWRRGQLE